MNYSSYGYWIKNGKFENKPSCNHIRVPFCDTHVVVPSRSLDSTQVRCSVENSSVSPAKSVHQASVSEPCCDHHSPLAAINAYEIGTNDLYLSD